MAEGMGFADVPARGEYLRIGFIGHWYGTAALARVLTKTYRTAAVVDMGGPYVSPTLSKASVIAAERATSDPLLRDVRGRNEQQKCGRRHERLRRHGHRGQLRGGRRAGGVISADSRRYEAYFQHAT